jgi:hypothetical protein
MKELIIDRAVSNIEVIPITNPRSLKTSQAAYSDCFVIETLLSSENCCFPLLLGSFLDSSFISQRRCKDECSR